MRDPAADQLERFTPDGRPYIRPSLLINEIVFIGHRCRWRVTPLTFSPEGTPFETRETA